MEFREKLEGATRRKICDTATFCGSLLPALLFGVAFGNIFQGLPMDDQVYHGSLLTLLNPYGVLTGVLFVGLFCVHGALWLAARPSGAFRPNALATAKRLWPPLLFLLAAFFVFTGFAAKLYDNFWAQPLWFVVLGLGVLSLFGVRHFAARNRPPAAFRASCLTVLSVVFTGFIGLYPHLIPSSLGVEYGLTIFNSSSSPYTLKIMTVAVEVFLPLAIICQIWLYRIFSLPEVKNGNGRHNQEDY